jgi:nucleotide-binding universal stress UspA family protein
MLHTTGSSTTALSHFVADPDGARYEADYFSRHAQGAAATVSAQQTVPAPTIRAGHIVVGVDGSEASLRALARAVDLARSLNTRLQIVTTWKHFAEYTDVGVVAWSPEHDAQEILVDAARPQFGSTLPEWVTATALEGGAAQRLIELSEDADMLVVGSRGHGGVVGLLLGSVSSACAEKAHCSVLVVH